MDMESLHARIPLHNLLYYNLFQFREGSTAQQDPCRRLPLSLCSTPVVGGAMIVLLFLIFKNLPKGPKCCFLFTTFSRGRSAEGIAVSPDPAESHSDHTQVNKKIFPAQLQCDCDKDAAASPTHAKTFRIPEVQAGFWGPLKQNKVM